MIINSKVIDVVKAEKDKKYENIGIMYYWRMVYCIELHFIMIFLFGKDILRNLF